MDPTMGRIVFYTPGDPSDTSAVEAPAIVSRVNKDATLDLTVFPPGAAPYSVSNVEASSAGGSEPARWCWPPAAPVGTGSALAPDADAEVEDDPPATDDGDKSEATGEADQGDAPAGGVNEGTGQPPAPEPPTTTAASELPLYTIAGDEVPDGFAPSGLETPESDELYHYGADVAGEPHKFDVGSVEGVELYADSDVDDRPAQPVTA